MSFKPVRRAQVISPMGVGAMIDFPRDESLMVAGLDAWPQSQEDCPTDWKIHEERLQSWLHVNHFRLPPDYRNDDEEDRYKRQQLPFVRFPRWHVCSSSSCGRMHKLSIFGNSSTRCSDKKHFDLSDYKKPRLIPVRFVAVCSKGHIEDFPFMEWVHKGSSPVGDHVLTYKAGRSAALSGIKISCSCGARRDLGMAFSYDPAKGGALNAMGYDCKGDQPWLGISGGLGPNCGEYLQAVQRGGSNVYFPLTYSSIYLPLWGEQTNRKIVKILEEPTVWSILSNGLDQGGNISKDRVDIIASMRSVNPEELLKAAKRKLEGVHDEAEQSEEDYRRSEYEAFRQMRGSAGSDLLVDGYSIEKYASWCANYFSSIRLIRKLRETRVSAGFSRLLPPDINQAAKTTQRLSKRQNISWLPALVVRGEGLFFEFRTDAIDRWVANHPLVTNRIDTLQFQYNSARIRRQQPPAVVTPKLVLLHTFAHLILRQLSFDCGYGSSALRERIYCNLEGGSENMQGILVYTASGDSEGTLGGLVRKGEPGNLEGSLIKAIRASSWCSSDPVCSESVGQGTDSANLAACHACTLLPETACEYGNRLLDRVLLAGTLSDPSAGYFADLLK